MRDDIARAALSATNGAPLDAMHVCEAPVHVRVESSLATTRHLQHEGNLVYDVMSKGRVDYGRSMGRWLIHDVSTNRQHVRQWTTHTQYHTCRWCFC